MRHRRLTAAHLPPGALSLACRARGISAEVARTMLVYSFGREVVQVRHAALRCAALRRPAMLPSCAALMVGCTTCAAAASAVFQLSSSLANSLPCLQHYCAPTLLCPSAPSACRDCGTTRCRAVSRLLCAIRSQPLRPACEGALWHRRPFWPTASCSQRLCRGIPPNLLTATQSAPPAMLLFPARPCLLPHPSLVFLSFPDCALLSFGLKTSKPTAPTLL